MRNRNTIFKLLLLLIVMIGAIYLRDNWPFATSESKTYTQKWSDYTPDKIASLRVAKNNQQVNLVKDGLVWKVSDYVADSQQIEALLTNLINPTSVEVVAETNTTHSKFGFSDASASLMLKAGDQEKKLLLGNVSNSGRYLRFDGEDIVYLLPNLPSLMDSTQISDWVDKTIAKFDQKDIQKITLERGRNSLSLTQTDNSWYQEGKSSVLDPAPLSGFLSTLTNLVTTGLVADQNIDVKAPEIKVIVKTNNSDTILTASPYQGEEYIITSSTRPGKFLVNKNLVDSLKLDTASLKPALSPTPTPASGK